MAVCSLAVVAAGCTGAPPGTGTALTCERTRTKVLDAAPLQLTDEGFLFRAEPSGDATTIAYALSSSLSEGPQSLRVTRAPDWTESAIYPVGPGEGSRDVEDLAVDDTGSVVAYVLGDTSAMNEVGDNLLRAHRRVDGQSIQAPLPAGTDIQTSRSAAPLSISDDGRWVSVVHGPRPNYPGIGYEHTEFRHLAMWDTTSNQLLDFGDVRDRFAGAVRAQVWSAVVTSDGAAMVVGLSWDYGGGLAFSGLFRLDRVAATMTPLSILTTSWPPSGSPSPLIGPLRPRGAGAVVVASGVAGAAEWLSVDIHTGATTPLQEPAGWAPALYLLDMATDGSPGALIRIPDETVPWTQNDVVVRDLLSGASSANLTDISPRFVPLGGNRDLTVVAGAGDSSPLGGPTLWLSSCSDP